MDPRRENNAGPGLYNAQFKGLITDGSTTNGGFRPGGMRPELPWSSGAFEEKSDRGFVAPIKEVPRPASAISIHVVWSVPTQVPIPGEKPGIAHPVLPLLMDDNIGDSLRPYLRKVFRSPLHGCALCHNLVAKVFRIRGRVRPRELRHFVVLSTLMNAL